MFNTLAKKFGDENPELFNEGVDLASLSMISFNVHNQHFRNKLIVMDFRTNL
jgi:hypothetical protein